MKQIQIQWTRTRQEEVLSRIVGYWAADVWLFGDCPIQSGKCGNGYALTKPNRFTCIWELLNLEMKYACWQKLERGEWTTNTCWKQGQHLKKLCDFINEITPETNSFLEKPLNVWEICFRTYLVENGLWKKPRMSNYLNKNNELIEYEAVNMDIVFLHQVYKILREDYDDRDEWDKEIWDARKLGLKLDPSRSEYTLNFTEIRQDWLYQAAKKFSRYNITLFSWRDCQKKLTALKDFSLYLNSHYPNLQPYQINRQLILDYFSELKKTGLAAATRNNYISGLQQFFELSARVGWAEVPDKRLIYQEDYPRIDQALPRFIPEEVMGQLNQHIDKLPAYLMRMTLVLQECGMRIGELCNISYNCLLRDHEGDYFLKYYQGKQKKEHTIPISAELVGVIVEQQEWILSQFGVNCPYLFVYPHETIPTPFKQDYFKEALNQLGYEQQIKDKTGKLWRFQPHQFRHSVGTRMINLGVPQHIVQRFLGHASPEMTSTYAHIFDQTLKQEFFKYKHKLVDVTGNIVTPELLLSEMSKGLDPNSIDSQWLKKNILAQALPTGLCALPVVQGSCPYGANKCLVGTDGNGCPHFKTDFRYLDKHQEHLERTNNIIDWALQNFDSRRSQEILRENIPVKDNLIRIIKGIESHDNSKEC